MGECRAGHRRYSGSSVGENYQVCLARLGEGEYNDPSLTQRTLGDLVDPSRSGSVMGVVNLASREVGGDVGSWSLVRVVGLCEGVVRERRERSG